MSQQKGQEVINFENDFRFLEIDIDFVQSCFTERTEVQPCGGN